MEVTAIGDIHGRNAWEKIVRATNTKHVVFVGDYFDSISISADEQIRNFREILSFQRQTSRKVILLIGNHDYHYLPHSNMSCIGYQEQAAAEIGNILSTSLDLLELQFAAEIDNVLYTHGGFTKTWGENVGYKLGKNINDLMLNLYVSDSSKLDFQRRALCEKNGDNIFQGPLWVRPNSLIRDPGFQKQVVGHTKMLGVNIQAEGDIGFIDTLGTSGEYLRVKNGEFEIHGKNSLSEEERNFILGLFRQEGENFCMKFDENFEFEGCNTGEKPHAIKTQLEGQVFGRIGETNLRMPFHGLIIEAYTKQDASVMGYHFRLEKIK